MNLLDEDPRNWATYPMCERTLFEMGSDGFLVTEVVLHGESTKLKQELNTWPSR